MAISKQQPLRPYVQALGDAMDSGDIVSSDAVQAFDTVADMQAATWLDDGMTCHTNGFHASGDGGAAYYTVGASGTANGMDVLALQGGLFATLVVTEPYVTPEQFGAYGDGTHDDTAAIQASVNKASVKLTKTYLISTVASANCITVPSYRTIEFDGATVTLAANALDAYSIFYLIGVSNVRIFGNGSIIGDKDTHTGTSGEWGNCIIVYNSKNVTIEGLTITKGWGDGVYIGSGNVAPSENVSVLNCNVSDNSRNNISVVALVGGRIDNLTLNDADRTSPMCGIDFEPNDNSIDCVRDVIMSNCTMSGNDYGFYPVLFYGAGSNDVTISDCVVHGKIAFNISSANSSVKVDGLKLINTDAADVQTILTDIQCAETSSIEIKGTIYNSHVRTRILRAATALNNVTVDFDVFGDGLWSACAIYGTLSSRSNITGAFRYHFAQTTDEGGPQAKFFDRYSCEFDTPKELTAIISAPSYGGDYEITSDSTNGISFRADRLQKGTRYVVKNSSSVAQPIRVTPTDMLAAGHIGIYEATSFGVINKILDIATS